MPPGIVGFPGQRLLCPDSPSRWYRQKAAALVERNLLAFHRFLRKWNPGGFRGRVCRRENGVCDAALARFHRKRRSLRLMDFPVNSGPKQQERRHACKHHRQRNRPVR